MGVEGTGWSTTEVHAGSVDGEDAGIKDEISPHAWHMDLPSLSRPQSSKLKPKEASALS